MEYSPRIYWDCANLDDCFKNSGGENGDYFWMQYTGLQDKNGKDVYEGDIIYFEEPEFESEMLTCLVVFFEGAFCAKWRNGYITLQDANGEFDKVEILGNIYESPDLLPPNPGPSLVK